MRARAFDQVLCTQGLAHISTIIAGDDPTARTALALMMIQLARRLDQFGRSPVSFDVVPCDVSSRARDRTGKALR